MFVGASASARTVAQASRGLRGKVDAGAYELGCRVEQWLGSFVWLVLVSVASGHNAVAEIPVTTIVPQQATSEQWAEYAVGCEVGGGGHCRRESRAGRGEGGSRGGDSCRGVVDPNEGQGRSGLKRSKAI